MDVFYQKEMRKKMHIKSHWYEWSINFIPQAIRKLQVVFTGQKMKFSIKDFFSKCDQIRSFQCYIHRRILNEKSQFLSSV